jgi:hypothetical protein
LLQRDATDSAKVTLHRFKSCWSKTRLRGRKSTQTALVKQLEGIGGG